MVKKLFIILIMFVCIKYSVYANIVPNKISDIPQNSIGVYQVENKLTVYKEPSTESAIIFEQEINYNSLLNTQTHKTLGILIPQKQLGYVYATDCDENWIEIIYDKINNQRGWVLKEDTFQFMPWVTFYNMYGRKYGLIALQDTQKEVITVSSQPDENAQQIAKVHRPKQIRLTSIEGNWALVSILDIENNTYTGYIQWRNIKGEYYIFPDVK